jgi:riboflavin kinase/FMN adenylyltransferase
MPAQGVYAVRVQRQAGGPWLPGVANLGTRPTFDGGAPVLEVHLLDFDGDLYGRSLRVGLVARLRDEQRFDGPEALVAALRADVARARELLAP